jgi:hypothetical protein
MKIIITFHTTYDSLKAETVLINADINIKIRPIPRHISSDCGLGIEAKVEDKEQILEVLQNNDVEYEGIYDLEG